MFAELVVTTEPPVETVSVTLLVVFAHVIVCDWPLFRPGPLAWSGTVPMNMQLSGDVLGAEG